MFKKLVAPKTEEEITKHWKYTDKIYTSVICITFNQDIYIRNAIDGFLAQVTEYKFEIIIHDDASTDNTKEILKEYQQRYPSLIKLILQDTNQFSINCHIPSLHALAKAGGEYIAVCEGDDYWIDSQKLSDQTKFLIENPKYSLHVYDCYEERDGAVDLLSSKLSRLSIKPGDHSSSDLKTNFLLLPLTSCFVNDFDLPFPQYFNKSINGDGLFCVLLSNKGGAYVDSTKKVGVYRLHDGGVWSLKPREDKFYETLHTKLVHARYFTEDKEVNKKILEDIVLSLINKMGKIDFIYFLFKRSIKKYIK